MSLPRPPLMTVNPRPSETDRHFGAVFAGGGELGALMRTHDWGSTPLGPVQKWPQSLKTAVRIILTSRQPFWIGWGPELTYLYNDPYKSIIGGKHPWALGRATAEVWREIWGDIQPMLDQAMRGAEGTYVERQLLIMERSGYPEETYYTFSYSPIPDDEGRPGGIICANTDDTERVIGARELGLLRDLATATTEARNARQAAEAASRSLEGNLRDLPFSLIYLAEGDGSFALAGTSGVTLGHEAAPRSIEPDAQATWPLSRALGGAETVLIDNLGYLAELPAGAWTRPPQRAVLLPITASAGSRPGVLVAGLNPFRQLDERYRSFLSLVTGQIAAGFANAEAHAAEHQRAEKLAEIDRAKTQFFSNVSHEFRTPLTLLLSPIEQLLARSPAKEDRTLLKLAQRNARRLFKLVNSLLDLSRVEAGRLKARYAPTDLASLTAELAGNFRSLVEAGGLALEIDCAALPEPVYVDRDLWEKIVFNLVSNAYKFTFVGSIRVALAVSLDGAGATLTVSDTGVGIPQSELEHMFERFHRVEGQRSRSFEGTGIGLALVREFVALHGGEVAAASETGQGSTFIVTLPFGRRHLSAQSIATSPARAKTIAPSRGYIEGLDQTEGGLDSLESLPLPPTSAAAGPRPRILIVDDNADMRAYLARLLAPAYDTITATTGHEALALIGAEGPDLVLSDVMMPELDGFALIAAVRARADISSLPFILMSARAGEEARVEGLEAGADDYLTKPFSARELMARIDGSLRLSRTRAEAASALGESAAELARRAADLSEAQRLARLGSWQWDAASDVVTGSAELYRIYGLDPETDKFPNFKDQCGALYFRDSWSAINDAMQEAVRSGVGYHLDVPALAKGTPIWVSTRSEVLCDAQGRIIGLRGTVQDITERKKAEESQKLLIDELNHRVKNTLAIVQSVATQTLRENPDPALFKTTFTARLQALSAAHGLLTRRTWQVAGLDELVVAALTPFRQAQRDVSRILIEGPQVSITPTAAISLVLMLHELATNAVKYGALSRPEGKLRVAWSRRHNDGNAPLIDLVWSERDGPPVRLPSRPGFGTRLIRATAEQMRAELNLDYHPAGVECRLLLTAAIAGA